MGGAVENLPNDVHGIAVHIAARSTQVARAGHVLVSSTVKDILVDSDLGFTPLARQRLPGVPGEWAVYEVQAAPQPAASCYAGASPSG